MSLQVVQAGPPPGSLLELLESNAGILYFLPSAEEYSVLQGSYTSTPSKPSIIIRPQTERDVSLLITHVAKESTPFTIRSGGHDLGSRSIVANTVCIDMRDLNYVHVADDKKTARIGGGILFGTVAEELEKEGLLTAVGSVGSVGFVGWSTLGGYGPFSPSLGLGLDQIVGARLVNARGNVVEANEEMLEGLRGGGGNFGVVTELTIKVYPTQEVRAKSASHLGLHHSCLSKMDIVSPTDSQAQVHTGILVFDSSDIASTVTTFFKNLNAVLDSTKLPRNLYLQPMILEVPGQGKTFMVNYVWLGASTPEEADWREKTSSCATLVASMVQKTTPSGMVAGITAFVPPRVHPGKAHAVSLEFPAISPQAVETLAKYAVSMPGDGVGMTMHALQGKATTGPFPPATFLNREEHWMVEMIGLSVTPEGAPAGRKWVEEFERELKGVEGAMNSTYFSLTWHEDVDLDKIYGEHLKGLRALKRKLDPENVFKFAVPRLGESSHS
jgi:FAD/FMN-containing dehydrogenase